MTSRAPAARSGMASRRPPRPTRSSTSRRPSHPMRSSLGPSTRRRSRTGSRTTSCAPRSIATPRIPDDPGSSGSSAGARRRLAPRRRTGSSKSSARNGFTGFKTNARIPGLPRWIEVDVLFAAHKLVIEVDGDKFHKTRYRRKKDARKQAIVEAAGLRVIRLVPDDVEPENETQTVARLRHAIPDD